MEGKGLICSQSIPYARVILNHSSAAGERLFKLPSNLAKIDAQVMFMFQGVWTPDLI